MDLIGLMDALDRFRHKLTDELAERSQDIANLAERIESLEYRVCAVEDESSTCSQVLTAELTKRKEAETTERKEDWTTYREHYGETNLDGFVYRIIYQKRRAK